MSAHNPINVCECPLLPPNKWRYGGECPHPFKLYYEASMNKTNSPLTDFCNNWEESPHHLRWVPLPTPTDPVDPLQPSIISLSSFKKIGRSKNVKVTYWSIMHKFNDLRYPPSNLSQIFTQRIFQPSFKKISKRFLDLSRRQAWSYWQKEGRTGRGMDRRTNVGNDNTLSAIGPSGRVVGWVGVVGWGWGKRER